MENIGFYDNIIDFEININDKLYNEYFGNAYAEHKVSILDSYHNGTLDFDKEKEFIINHGPIGLALMYDLSNNQLSKILDAACLDKKCIFSLLDYKNVYNIRLGYLKSFVDKLSDNILYISALTYNSDLNDYIAEKILSFSDDDIYSYISSWNITKKYTALLFSHIDKFIINLFKNDTESLFLIVDVFQDSLPKSVLSFILSIKNDMFFDMVNRNICYREMFTGELEEAFDKKIAPYFVLQQLKGSEL